MSTTIPVIDIAPVRCRARGDIESVAKALENAAADTGFFYVRNHGISQTAIDDARRAAIRYFAFAEAVKRTNAVNTLNRGFMEVGACVLEQAPVADLKEVFFWGPEVAASDQRVADGMPLTGPNNWPDFMPELRDGIWPYYQQAMACGADLLRVVARVLGVAQDFFEQRYRQPLGRGQLVYYPPRHDYTPDAQYGAAPHTDFGCITLLLQDHHGGLEILGGNGQWVAATPIADTLVINIGDLLGRWSSDRLASTRHRVMNRSGERRHSVAIFYDPDADAVVDPNDLSVAQSTSIRYEPVTAGAYIMSRNRNTFRHFQEKTGG